MIFFKDLEYNPAEVISKRDLKEGGKVQRYIDSECIRLMDPLTPFDRGTLKGAATTGTNIGSGRIVQQTPYAKRWYYEPANFNGAPTRGNKWFERMKNSNKATILQGAARLAGAKVR
ncbi:MAG: hypothetical protein E7A85_00190 [Anaerococcus sp.]|nr:hypothetical protein [Anaerococcus sp.]DAM67737.1 MAG TPA: Minor capsid protein [Caudoviricetes sp.]